MPIDAIVDEERAAIDTIVPAPESIRTVSKATEVLGRIRAYEKLTGRKAVVLLVQNRQLGEMYRITSEEEAQRYMTHKGDGEVGAEILQKELYEQRGLYEKV